MNEDLAVHLKRQQRVKALRSQIWMHEREALAAQESARKCREELAELEQEQTR